MSIFQKWRMWRDSRKLRRGRYWYTWKQRRRTDELDAFPWHLLMVPRPGTPESKGEHSEVWRTAVFVVHGIGTQKITETAALLRSGFDNVLEDLETYINEGEQAISPPLIRDGYWADYDDIEKTFEAEWKRFSPESQNFFANLWRQRLFSSLGTILWFSWQPLRLLFNRRVFRQTVWWKVPFLYLLYMASLVPIEAILIAALIRYPRVVHGFLTDVRLYFGPKGITERAIVQRIDFTVRKKFMKTLGLDWDFQPLNQDELLNVTGEKVAFNQVVWVAHSLGTVISYNVLADLMAHADRIERMPPDDPERKVRIAGVKKFRSGLMRFVTLGSPLDKIAVLFPERITPWAEWVQGQNHGSDENWWVNCYHVLDPVSGSLGAESIRRYIKPANFHIGFWHLPGYAHLAYWRDRTSLWFVLQQIFPEMFKKTVAPKAWRTSVLTLLALLSYLTAWMILIATYLLVVYMLDHPGVMKWLLGLF
jgi:hypothetical protein